MVIASGGFNSDITVTTDVIVKTCTGDNCIPEEDLNELIQKIDIELLFMNANFDPKNLDTPISYYADKRLFQELIPGVQKDFSINLKRQRGILSDDYMSSNKVEKYFFEVQEISNNLNRYSRANGAVIHYRFQASGVNTIYQRSIFNLFDALSRLGGVYSALFSGGLLFSNAFSYRLMMSSLMGRLFYFRPRFASEVAKSKKKKKKQSQTQDDGDSIEDKTNLKRNPNYNLLDPDYEIKHDPLDQLEKDALRKLIVDKKARFSYKTCDILKSLISLQVALPRFCLRRFKHSRNDLYYKIAIEHIDKELDIANILKKIRTLNFFMKMILDTDQRKLLKLRSSKLLDSDEPEAKSIFKVKKCVDKGKMLDMYIENLRQKEVDERDIKLLRIVGLNEIVDILKSKHMYQNSLLERRKKMIPQNKNSEIWKQGVNMNDLREIMESNFDIGIKKFDMNELGYASHARDGHQSAPGYPQLNPNRHYMNYQPVTSQSMFDQYYVGSKTEKKFRKTKVQIQMTKNLKDAFARASRTHAFQPSINSITQSVQNNLSISQQSSDEPIDSDSS